MFEGRSWGGSGDGVGSTGRAEDGLPLCFLFLYFIYLFLAMLGLRCHAGFSLVAASEGSFVVMHGFLIVLASLVEHGS